MRVGGARKNNLKSVDVEIPLDRFTVITGPSGSGKTSLAFDTLFSEGQRRFVESLSTYARRFLGRLDRAPVDRLDGIGPAIAIDQKAASRSPRSTVATATEIQDYLRLLWARVGRPHCPEHGQELVLWTPGGIARDLVKAFGDRRGYVLAPIHVPASVAADPGELDDYLERERGAWREQGFVRVLWNGAEHRLDTEFPGTDGVVPELSLVVDRTRFDDRSRLVDAVQQAESLAHGRVIARTTDGEERIYTTDRSCPHCGHVVPTDPHPRWFSFNHHSGACSTCAGLGRLAVCEPAFLVNHPKRPVFDGGIDHRGAAFSFLVRRDGWFHTVAAEVADQLGFDLDTPFEDLSQVARHVLMRGCGERRFEVVFSQAKGRTRREWRMSVQWKGLCTQVEEWFHGKDPTHADERFQSVMREDGCPECQGERLGRAQRHVLVGGRSLGSFTRMTVDDAHAAMEALRLRKSESSIAADILVEVRNRLTFLRSVGLGYLGLDRSAATLSGGEAQRIRLATQLGNRLVGVLYVLDEPTIGLHPRDTARLMDTLFELRDLGNTVVAVEHDESVIRRADWVVDMGPGAGHRGGEVVASGTPVAVARDSAALTGQYLRGELGVPVPTVRRQPLGHVVLENCDLHNLKGFDVRFPLGVLTAVTGVSGSGKSTLVLDTLVPILEAERARLEGVGRARLVVVDQGPIGTTPSSNPATYTGVFTPIRELFAALPVSRMKGFGVGRFSFNVSGGRCDACEGKGHVRVEMHFLADVWVPCEVCRARRYNAETLTVELRGKNIADVLEMEIDEAVDFFGNQRRIVRPLKLLQDVGLGYLKLGQAANTLSGGEAQRIKLCAHLAKRSADHTVFVLDEPTTGLHIDDVRKLVDVVQRLVARGDTVIVVEHHLDVIKCADHVLELGPDAGPGGGHLIFAGTPEELAARPESSTGAFLADVLPRAGKAPGRRRGGRVSSGLEESAP
ncbi:MAG: excinuclease ABC subunit UvrA [Planctomycetota bacterium]|nr:excinuclease ABC subunit UvrA [Planctomycetota bacterium]